MGNVFGTGQREPLVLLGPLNYTIVDCNKPLIMRNGGELTKLEYLPTKTEYPEYLWNAGTRTSRLFWPFKLHNNRFKRVLDHGE